ncbi:MAG TPA: hypothetical protein VIX63_12455 [Vicinamibacterales bacterium]
MPFWLMFLAVFGAGCTPGGGRPKAEYDETGRLRRLTFDVTGNGRHDAVSVMDGSRVRHIELDANEDGRVDRWDFYREGRTLDKVGFSTRNNGVMDAQAFYNGDGTIERIEVSATGGGSFNRVEFYTAGVLVRSEEDTNGDHRPDKWETYRPNRGGAPGEPPYAITSVAFDDTGSGSPHRRVMFPNASTRAPVEVR